MDFEEIVKRSGELVTILKNDDTEIQHLKECVDAAGEIEDIKAKMNEDVKKCIKAMTNVYVEEQSKADNSRSEEEILCQEEIVRKEMIAASTHVKELKENIDEVNIEFEEVNKKRVALEEGKEQIEKSSSISLPKAKCEYNLFSNLTNIRWDLESSSDEVKGYICLKKGVKPFCLNKKQNSQFFITNYLWDLMEEDW